MSVKSEIWAMAHVRRCFGEGLTAVVARKGAPEAGAIYIRIVQGMRQERLLGPAPGPAYDDDGNRRWREFLPALSPSMDAEDILNREISWDPDLWVLEIDDRTGQGLIEPDTIEVS